MPDRGQFKDMIDDDDILEALDSDDADGVFDAQMNLGMGQLESGREVLPHRVGGWPYPGAVGSPLHRCCLGQGSP